jgi:methylglyoxal synthase
MDFRFLRVENMKIAIIAHDGKKAEMVHFLMRHKAFLSLANIDLVATGTTGKDVESAGLVVEKVMSGPLGGDAQIAAMVTEGKVEMVFFFRDPLDKHPHEPDINMLMRICDVYNVPLATNPATAEGLLKGLENDIIA